MQLSPGSKVAEDIFEPCNWTLVERENSNQRTRLKTDDDISCQASGRDVIVEIIVVEVSNRVLKMFEIYSELL